MYKNWDSWFWNQRGPFKYYKKTYTGAEINYIVGGHAFRHYGFDPERMRYWIYKWKKRYGRSKDDAVVVNSLRWAYQGYNEYYVRNDW